MKNHVQPGQRITYANATGNDIVSGQLVPVDGLVGVATGDIADGTTGELAVGAVYEVAKETTDVITQGMKVTLDVSSAKARDTSFSPAAGDIVDFGVAWAAADGTASVVQVYVDHAGGAVTP